MLLVLVLVLALDVAAFGDITNGVQTNLNRAYWTIAMSVVVLGGMLAWYMQPEEKAKKPATTSKKKPVKKK